MLRHTLFYVGSCRKEGYRSLWGSLLLPRLLLCSILYGRYIFRSVAAMKLAVCCSSVAAERFQTKISGSRPPEFAADVCILRPLSYPRISKCGQVWRMCSGVCSSDSLSTSPSLFSCFLSHQCPVRGIKCLHSNALSKSCCFHCDAKSARRSIFAEISTYALHSD